MLTTAGLILNGSVAEVVSDKNKGWWRSPPMHNPFLWAHSPDRSVPDDEVGEHFNEAQVVPILTQWRLSGAIWATERF